MSLPRAPTAIVNQAGEPAMGRYQGLADHFDWPRLAAPHARSALWRRFHHKRWHYVALATEQYFCGIAIVDVGWTSTAFAYVFERQARCVVAAFSQDGLPGLSAQLANNASATSRFSAMGKRIRISQSALNLHSKAFSIDAHYEGQSKVLLAVGQANKASVHATQKSGALALSGHIQIGGRSISLDGGCASYDYSNGLLARETDWRWASAHAPGIGFNLQQGYFGANENALWLGEDLIPLGAANFDYQKADPLQPWHIWTDDGLLELSFQPEGARREDKNLIIAASRYVQPIGSFSGQAMGQKIVGLLGVTEDHHSRW